MCPLPQVSKIKAFTPLIKCTEIFPLGLPSSLRNPGIFKSPVFVVQQYNQQLAEQSENFQQYRLEFLF